MTETDFLIQKDLKEVDEEVHKLIQLEEERQARKLILIASESICPRPVKKALASVFTNLYAEGYPHLKMVTDNKRLLLDFEHQLAYHRRYADRRYYKGCEYVNFIEALCQKRAAELFATPEIPAERIYANVQPLSGSAGNNAVYDAFLKPGDTVMGMALNNGGHLTHGSESNRSGKFYNIISYEVSKVTGKLDYEEIKRLAVKHEPKMIIAGYSAYPWDVDWKRFREIADSVPEKAILLADVSHTAGLIVAGLLNNPIGYADVIMFTTHKTICGPRGAVILTTDREKAQRIDSAVFPGEQGGAHFNNIAAKAVAFEIAGTENFRELQRRIKENARHLAESFEKLGFKLAYGGTDTHMLLIDLKSVKTKTGQELTGEIATRILDLCGITCNKNTIAGDENPVHPTGIRFGTTWVTQRGFGKKEIEKLAELVHKVLTNIYSFTYIGPEEEIGRGKIEFEIIEEVKREVERLESRCAREFDMEESGYPHYYSLRDGKEKRTVLFEEHERLNAKFGIIGSWKVPLSYGDENAEIHALKDSAVITDNGDKGLLLIKGDPDRVKPFLQEVATNNIYALNVNECQRSFLFDKEGRIIDDVLIHYIGRDEIGWDQFILETNAENTEKVKIWLRSLSDGYVIFDDDIYAKIEGPVVVRDLKESNERTSIAVHGQKSFELLKRLSANIGIENNHFSELELSGVKAIVCRADYDDITSLNFYVRPEDAVSLWNALLKEARELGIKPAGLSARNYLRNQSKLPSYGSEREDCISLYKKHQKLFALSKPYFISQKRIIKAVKPSSNKDEFEYKEKKEVKRSYLYEEHLKLTDKSSIVLFAGWEMPIKYTSINEEHKAVRETAGLFDLSHMGILEVSGMHATNFLNLVTTNYPAFLKVGQSHYSHILDIDGNVMDDVFIYRRGKERYMIVVNAVNAEKIKKWFNAVNSKRCIIDRENPLKEIECSVVIKDLKDKSSGDEQRIDIGLQGPNSLRILQACADDRLKKEIAELMKLEFIETKLQGIEVMISRTGYTGEELGYELYVHPRDASKLWNLLLEKGRDFGIKPAGLGARDSTRTEAGFPLYGNELAGEYSIFPTETGYGAFVKLHKPFFIGRDRALQKARDIKKEIIRFRLDKRGGRVIKKGDPVIDKSGRFIGNVTSCVVVDGYQLGMAYVNKGYNKEGTKVCIFPLPRTDRIPEEKPKDRLEPGDRLLLHEEARVLPRFYVEKEREMQISQG